MRCRDLMNTMVHMCREDDTVHRCARVMKNENVGFVPIVDAAGKLLGVVTDRDLALRVLASGLAATTAVREIMTTDIATCEADRELRDAEELMKSRRVGRIVVLGPYGRCLGVLSLSDVLRVEEGHRAANVAREVLGREAKTAPSLR